MALCGVDLVYKLLPETKVLNYPINVKILRIVKKDVVEFHPPIYKRSTDYYLEFSFELTALFR